MDPFVGHFSRYLQSKGAEGKSYSCLGNLVQSLLSCPGHSPRLSRSHRSHLSSSDHRSSLQFFFFFVSDVTASPPVSLRSSCQAQWRLSVSRPPPDVRYVPSGVWGGSSLDQKSKCSTWSSTRPSRIHTMTAAIKLVDAATFCEKGLGQLGNRDATTLSVTPSTSPCERFSFAFASKALHMSHRLVGASGLLQ